MTHAGDRESVWSVASGTKTWYFFLFIVQCIIGIGFIAYKEISSLGADTWLNSLLNAWVSLAPIVIASAAIAISLTEIGRYIMVLSRGLEERLERKRKALREEGREEALKHVNQLLKEYESAEAALEEASETGVGKAGAEAKEQEAWSKLQEAIEKWK